MVDFELLNSLLIPMVVVCCGIVGFLWKNYSAWNNDLIPIVLTVLGAILSCVACHDVSFDIIVGGMASGLASTGIHQILKAFANNGGRPTELTEEEVADMLGNYYEEGDDIG